MAMNSIRYVGVHIVHRESVICRMKLGKAAGLDGLYVEHLRYCSISLPCILAKLFNLMLFVGCVPIKLLRILLAAYLMLRALLSCL